MSEAPLAVLRNVSKAFNGVPALSDVSLSVGCGEFIAVIGPSGSGKTTMIKILAGFESPDTGEVLMNGEYINERPPWRRNMPMVWQNLALFPFLNVLENAEFGLKMRGVSSAERRRRSMEWLEKLDIKAFAGRAVSDLSGGQRQRVALARTLVMEPKILLLDEPLSALDANMVVHMQGVLSQLQKEAGITFFYVTHSHSEAFAMADRIVVMDAGRIQQIGTPQSIYRTPRNRFVAKFIGANNIFQGRAAGLDCDSRLRIETAEGIFAAPIAGSPPAAGTPVDFVVAAANTEIRAAGDEGIACRLVGEEFVGGFVLLHLQTASSMPLLSQIRADSLEKLGDLNGRQLRLCWPPEKSHVLIGDNGQR